MKFIRTNHSEFAIIILNGCSYLSVRAVDGVPCEGVFCRQVPSFLRERTMFVPENTYNPSYFARQFRRVLKFRRQGASEFFLARVLRNVCNGVARVLSVCEFTALGNFCERIAFVPENTYNPSYFARQFRRVLKFFLSQPVMARNK